MESVVKNWGGWQCDEAIPRIGSQPLGARETGEAQTADASVGHRRPAAIRAWEL